MLKIKIKRIIKFIGISAFTAISIFLLMFSYGYGFVYSDTITPGQDSLDQIKTEKEETRKKIEQAQKEQDAYSKQVQEVETKLLSSLSELDELNKKESQAKQKMDKTTILLVQNELEIAQLESELKEKSDI